VLSTLRHGRLTGVLSKLSTQHYGGNVNAAEGVPVVKHGQSGLVTSGPGSADVLLTQALNVMAGRRDAPVTARLMNSASALLLRRLLHPSIEARGRG